MRAVNRLTLLFLSLIPGLLRAQENELFDYRPTTVVIYNSTDEASTELANYYAKQRGIPSANLVGLKCTSAPTITREVFQNEIENPLRRTFDQRKWWETARTPKEGLLAVKTTMRVLAIMQGVPMSVTEASHGKDPKTGKEIVPQALQQNSASVDSELTAFGVIDKPIDGIVNNPYFNSTKPFASTPLAPMFLVGRIDGPDKLTAKRLIDDAIAVEKEGLYGKAYIDLALKNQEGYKMGEDWLTAAARTLELNGVPVMMDTWAPTLPQNFPMTDCALYLGWYTEHADGPFLNKNFRFRRGAVACHIHSFSAYTIKTESKHWCGPILARGACGTLGNVFEPYLGLCANLDVFTDRLMQGFSLSEAAWCSVRGLSWMSVVLGDPLYRPFATPAGGGDKKVAADYKALRLAMQRWGKPEDAAALTENLERAAKSLNSPVIYEFLALHAQAGAKKAWPAAEQWFTAAMAAATPEGQMRLQFLMADAMRRDGDTKQATKLLNAVAEKNPAAPEAAAARAWIQQMR